MDEVVELLGQSRTIQVVREQLSRLLARQRGSGRLPPVLILGPTGSGKGLVARLLHASGARSRGPFIEVNCAGIPAPLLESELFGAEQGAFTDARRARPGLFQTAHGGVLFLDEVALLPEPAQAKLLRAVEDRAVRRLGSTRLEPVDVWVLSATNADLRAEVAAGRFRADLYHRLAVLTLELPRLADRGDDVILLAERFLARTCADYALPAMRLDPGARARLRAYDWPGNVRQLANVIERAALFADGPVVTAEALGRLEAEGAVTLSGARREHLRQQLLAALEEAGGNVSHAAARLGIARNTVYARLVKLGMHPGRRAAGDRSRDAGPERVKNPSGRAPGLQWERRSVAFLRIDVGEVPGADTWSQTGRLLDAAVSKVSTFHGRIEGLSPSQVFASFGAEGSEHAPRLAALAGLSILKEVERGPAGRDILPPVRVGVHVAPVLVGRTGSQVDIDATSLRAGSFLLDRLTEAAQAGEAVVSRAAAAFLDRRFETEPMDRTTPGSEPVFRLTGRERRGFGLWGGMTKFVGRAAELDIVRSRLVKASAGNGQIVAIVGEAGIGKSRLIQELIHSLGHEAWQVLEAGTMPDGDNASSYAPVRQLLRGYFGIQERHTHAEIEERVTTRLRTLSLELEPTRAALLNLLDVPSLTASWQRFTPAQRRWHALHGVKSLLLAEARVKPAVVAFEDLGRIDAETQAFLDLLVGAIDDAPLALLVAYRPEYRHAWNGRRHYTEIRLGPLPAQPVGELLGVLLGMDSSLDRLKSLLSLKAEGNPLFVEEIVRELAETQAVVGERGAYRLAAEVSRLDVPPTVQALLASRIDRLGAEDRRLLEIAAVIGKDVPLSLLEAVTGAVEGSLSRWLEALQAAEFLHQTPSAPDAEFTFKHPLTHEVAYGSVPEGRRRSLHGAIAAAIERRYPERLAEHVERLAHHAVRSHSWTAAVRYLRDAGRKAVDRSALHEAVSWFEGALQALSHLPEDRSALEQAVDLRLDLRHAVGNRGDQPRAVQHLLDAVPLAEKLGDTRRLGRLYAFLVNGNNLLGDLQEAIRCGDRAREIASSLGDEDLRTLIGTFAEQTYVFLGDYRRGAELAKANLERLGSHRRGDRFGAAMPPAVYDRGWLLLCLTHLGRFAEGLEVARVALEIAEESGHAISVGWAGYTAGTLYAGAGEWAEAEKLYERAIQAMMDGQWLLQLPQTLAASARTLAVLRRSDEALTRARQAEAQFESARAGWRRGNGVIGPQTELGHAYLDLGRGDDARRLSDRTLGVPSCTGPMEVMARYLRGEILTRTEPAAGLEAERHYRRALEVAEQSGMRPFAARCHLGLGKLYRRAGSASRANEHLVNAIALCRGMEMRAWLREAEAEQRELG